MRYGWVGLSQVVSTPVSSFSPGSRAEACPTYSLATTALLGPEVISLVPSCLFQKYATNVAVVKFRAHWGSSLYSLLIFPASRETISNSRWGKGDLLHTGTLGSFNLRWDTEWVVSLALALINYNIAECMY